MFTIDDTKPLLAPEQATELQTATADGKGLDWSRFLDLTYPLQQRLRELAPQHVADLERQHFTKFEAGGGR